MDTIIRRIDWPAIADTALRVVMLVAVAFAIGFDVGLLAA